MANQKIIERKASVVEEIADKMKNSSSYILFEYRGLTVAEISAVKRELLQNNAKLCVYKNTLVDRAADATGYTDLKQFLEGPNALISSEDSVSGAKIVANFAKKYENLVIKGALVDGKVIGKDEVIALSKLPNKEGMISMLLSVLQAPVRGFACALKAVADKQ